LNASASVLSSQGADAYGHPIVSPTTNDPFDGYGAQLGYYTDHETGLQLLGYRYYDPTNGRFINRDPAGANGGLDAYRYACNSPVSAWDPSGLHPGFGQRDASGLGGWMGLVKYLSPVDMACDFLGKMGTDFGNLAGNATPTAWANCSRDVGEGLLTIDGPEGEVAEGAAAGIKSIEEIDAELEGLTLRGAGSPGSPGAPEPGPGYYQAQTNSEGGTVWTSVGSINRLNFASIVTDAAADGGDINILTGVHGSPTGELTPYPSFYINDWMKFGGNPNVNVQNILGMTEEEIGNVVNGPGTTIGAFSNSEVYLSRFFK
jgi:RHS repeat-associated protein